MIDRWCCRWLTVESRKVESNDFIKIRAIESVTDFKLDRRYGISGCQGRV